LNPKNYWEYFSAFYQKHGFIKTFLLLYFFCGILYVIIKHYGWLPKKSVKGEHVFITGGGSGIGRQISIILAKMRAKVTVTDVNLEGAEETVRLIKNKAGHALALKVDVTSVEDIHNAAEAARAKFGPVTMLINNAGIVNGKHMTDMKNEEAELVYKVNTISHIYTVKEFLPSMLKKKRTRAISSQSLPPEVPAAWQKPVTTPLPNSLLSASMKV
jgi:all-trans-retinol dehydrogenase (NAD+)